MKTITMPDHFELKKVYCPTCKRIDWHIRTTKDLLECLYCRTQDEKERTYE